MKIITSNHGCWNRKHYNVLKDKRNQTEKKKKQVFNIIGIFPTKEATCIILLLTMVVMLDW
jgi:hypothetical protein